MSEIIRYFAYGSNLSPERLEERLGWVPPSRQGFLSGYRLSFNKRSITQGVCANLISTPQHLVWGVVYDCDSDDIAVLDSYEGVKGGHYQRQEVRIKISPTQYQQAITYVAGEQFIVPEASPHPTYFQHIWDGAKAHALPATYLNWLSAFYYDNAC